MSLLKDRVVFLTGAANGIGRECALVYAREGAVVAAADIDFEKARQLAEEIGGDALALRCDAGEASSVQSAIAQTERRLGRIDAIYNKAGIVGPARPLHESTEAEWDDLLRVNLMSVYLTARYGFEAVRAARGAMISLIEAMTLDYASFGVRVNAVFLLSDKARFITGCILPVTGGAELGHKRVADTHARQD